MKIISLGAGPSGLYFAICMKLANADNEVSVYERNKAGDTFGWGIVFSDQTVENLIATDPISGQRIANEFIHWDKIDCFVNGRVERSDGHGFIGLGRKRMLEILHDRCRELGVDLHFNDEFEAEDLDGRFADADIIVAADGLNSKIRNADLNLFECSVDERPNKFVWLGTKQTFSDAFTFIFEKTQHGWIWAHAYQFDQHTSTFIVECNRDVYDAIGFDHMSHSESAAVCEKIFSKQLNGHQLMTNSDHIKGSAWLNFSHILCANWIKDDRIVLIGDAAHTAHFSIGSGTKLGLEDAISLSRHLASGKKTADALKAFQAEREVESLRLQNAATNAMIWFENVPRYASAFDLKQFNYSLLTRSQRVSHENLRLRDKTWLEGLENHLARQVLGEHCEDAVPPMFLPYKLGKLALINRVVVSPMSMYSAIDGVPNDWHLVHYGASAKGGAGLIYTEMTDISAQSRITPGCAGIWTDQQEDAWKRIVEFIHNHTAAKFAIQLGHAGAKGATKEPWNWHPDRLDDPLPPESAWPLVSASATAYDSYSQVPAQINRQQMDEVRNQFVDAAVRADRAGFDMLELHAAHGYLLSAFITPIMNKRNDRYGGNLANRLRYPLEVFEAIKAIWPAHKPISVRISAHDWMQAAGNSEDDAVAIARAFTAVGADAIDVSSGQVSHLAQPRPGRMFQTPLSDRIRNEAGIVTMAVGNIYELDHVNSIIAAGRADLVCLGRAHLADPNWTLRAAANMNYNGIGVNEQHQYHLGYRQLQTNLQRADEMATI